MVYLNRRPPVIRSNYPRAGSRAGIQKRAEFIAAMGVILGDTRMLWTPKGTDNTTATEDSRHAATITWDDDVSGRLTPLGSGWAQSFNNIDQEGDIPDADIYSRGDGAVDGPMSIVALCNPDVNELSMLIAKENSSSVDEWNLGFNGSGHPTVRFIDASSSGFIQRRYATIITVGAYILIVATYDGSRTALGINIYADGLRKAVIDGLSGTYEAMENTAALVHVGAQYTSKQVFFDGKIALLAVCAKALSAEDNWDILKRVNGFFDLEL